MKIALVVHDVGRLRGHDRYALELALSLADRHEIHIFARTCSEIESARIVFHRVPAPDWPDAAKMIVFLISATWMLARHRFDLVHVQGASSLTGDIFTAHICQARWQEVYRTLDHTGLSFVRRWYQRLTATVMGKIERYVYRSKKTRRIIALSEQVKKDLIRYYGCPAEQIDVVHNGINLDEFHPDHVPLHRRALRTQWGIAEQAFVMLFVGDFQRKGLRHAIEALARLGIPDACLMVVGGGDTGPYEQLAKQLGKPDSVRFSGHQSPINRYYAMSDVVVFPTLYEPFGFTITETMAMGLPVITSAEAGAAEIVRNGEDGLLLTDPRDAGEIARHLQRLADDPGFRATLGRNARIRVASLSWPLFARRVEQIYLSVVKGA
ncbi:MAG: glycosyltransferase family 4 protein [candidate division Zixibacteria bacterium]|nr:glycosyltransferase family 4 protein [candidate division Zixibacteria bacterium]